jgi:UDP-3-O-[3-hydroxymyristoyl] glucosamine N-acyltransferase
MAKHSTLNEIAALVEGTVGGDGSLQVRGLNSIDQAAGDEITFVTNAKMASRLAGTKAAAAIVPLDLEEPGLPHIRVENPEYAATLVHGHFLAQPFAAQGIHPSAVVGRDCRIADEISIGPLVVIGDRVRIEARVAVHPGVVIGDDCVIGEDTIIYPNVTIAKGSQVGSRVIIHAGAAIGSDGFGYATDPKTGTHLKKPQVGNVRIDDDVEIGANSCVDRAAFGTTRIRSGVKIDNLVMIAHNVDIGENSILVGQVGIAGSTTLGRNVVLGGMAGVAGHLHIGDRVMAAAMSGVHTNLKEGSVVGGLPAVDVKKWGRSAAVFSRLPDMYKEIRHLRKELDSLNQLLLNQAEGTDSDEEEG